MGAGGHTGKLMNGLKLLNNNKRLYLKTPNLKTKEEREDTPNMR